MLVYPSYERNIFLFISIYRYFTFILAAFLMLVLPLSKEEFPSFQAYITVGLVGIYIIARVFLPYKPQRGRGNLANYFLLGSDLGVAQGALIASGGLSSGFLVYSLIPIISAALIFDQKVTFPVVAISLFSLLVVHLGLSQLSGQFPWLMLNGYFSMLLLYSIACILIVIIPYQANLNIRRRIERESIIEERKRMRREIHDGIAQSLGYLNLKAGLLQQSLSKGESDFLPQAVKEIQEVIQNTYTDIRESVDSLTLEKESFSLLPSLNKYLQDFSSKTQIEVEADLPKRGINLLPNEELQFLRIAQEALSNVRKHAEASKVWLSLRESDAGVELVIKDNGRGFNLQGENQKGHHGLQIMRERIEGLGGTLSINSQPDEGTEIKAILPR